MINHSPLPAMQIPDGLSDPDESRLLCCLCRYRTLKWRLPCGQDTPFCITTPHANAIIRPICTPNWHL